MRRHLLPGTHSKLVCCSTGKLDLLLVSYRMWRPRQGKSGRSLVPSSLLQPRPNSLSPILILSRSLAPLLTAILSSPILFPSQDLMPALWNTLGFAFFASALSVYQLIPALIFWELLTGGHPLPGLIDVILGVSLSFGPFMWHFLNRMQLSMPLVFFHMPIWLHLIGAFQGMSVHRKMLFGDKEFLKAAEDQAALLRQYAADVLSGGGSGRDRQGGGSRERHLFSRSGYVVTTSN